MLEHERQVVLYQEERHMPTSPSPRGLAAHGHVKKCHAARRLGSLLPLSRRGFITRLFSFFSRYWTDAEAQLSDGTAAIHLACVQRHRDTPHFPPDRCARRLSPLKRPELSHRVPE
jgi:hypothetical protein